MKSLIAFMLFILTQPALADAPEIQQVTTTRTGDTWRIDVTLSHPDTGWDHYADGWRVLDMQGKELGLRVLAHPHVNEQPFTRSLGGISIPEGTKMIIIQSRCLVDGWNSKTVQVPLN